MVEYARDVPRPLSAQIVTAKHGVGAGRRRVEWVPEMSATAVGKDSELEEEDLGDYRLRKYS